MTTRKETQRLTQQLFEEFQSGGTSVRGLSRKYKIPFTTLRDRFRRQIGQNYRLRSGKEGTITSIVREHLDILRKSPPSRSRDAAFAWFEANRESIYEQAYQDNLSGESRLYTAAKIQRDTDSLCRLDFDLASSPFLEDSRYSPEYYDDETEEYTTLPSLQTPSEK